MENIDQSAIVGDDICKTINNSCSNIRKRTVANKHNSQEKHQSSVDRAKVSILEDLDSDLESDNEDATNILGNDDRLLNRFEYDFIDGEYVPKVKTPIPGEDSDDALLTSKTERNMSLTEIASALVKNAHVNLENYQKEKSKLPDDASLLDTLFYCFGGSKKLLNLEHMPSHLQFNKYVHGGYREIQGAWGCFLSLFYLHNETVNILTHLLPIAYILLYWKAMFPWDEIGENYFLRSLGWSHIAACIAPWIGSVIYHLFMNHEGGSLCYQWLLQFDMFGIWVTQCFGALTNLCATVWCHPKPIQTIVLTIYGLLGFIGLRKALTAWTPVARRLCFLPVFGSRLVALIFRIHGYGGGEPSVLIHVILQDVVSVTGGIIGVARIPEKWLPGRLDYGFNSHHLMHILVVAAVFHLNEATNGDVRWILKRYTLSSEPKCLTENPFSVSSNVTFT